MITRQGPPRSMPPAAQPITRDEWLAAIGEADQAPLVDEPGVVTVQELRALLGGGIGRNKAQAQAERLIALGKAERARKHIRRGDGVVITVPAYRLIARQA